jgi:hypothetical protein
VPAGEGARGRRIEVGRCFRQAGWRDDMITYPLAIGFAGSLFDDFAEQRETVIRVFERRARRERLRRGKIGADLRLAQEGSAIRELTAVGPVARETRRMRKQLREGNFRDYRRRRRRADRRALFFLAHGAT